MIIKILVFMCIFATQFPSTVSGNILHHHHHHHHLVYTRWNKEVQLDHGFHSTNLFFSSLYFWLCWVFVGAHWLSRVAASEGHSLVVVRGLLIAVAAPVAEYSL